MFKEIYRRKIENKLEETNLLRLVELAKKYGKILSDNELDPLCDPCYFEPVFVKVSYRCETYVCFYKNLMLVFDQGENFKAVTIYMKPPRDEWGLVVTYDGYGEKHVNVLSPGNTHARVYIGYTVKVLDVNDTREEYISGSWNKEFYRTMNELIGKMEGLTEYSALERAY